MTPRTYPIVLAHGIARFDALVDMVVGVDNDDAFDHKHYFKNIRTHLNSLGFDTWHTQVDWAGPVATRASDLKRGVEAILQKTGAAKVHIIGHSMGGLDARHMLFDNKSQGFHQKVASVTTIATPHQGSPVADFVRNPIAFFRDRAEESVASPEEQLEGLKDSDEFREFARLFEIDPERFGAPPSEDLESVSILAGLAGVLDLTTEATAAFNAASLEWEKTSGVSYQAYAGAQPRDQIFLPLRFAWSLIHDREGDNDGLVSVESAKWAREHFQKTLEADHLNELGWWPDIHDTVERARKEQESRAFYSNVAEGLAKRFPLP